MFRQRPDPDDRRVSGTFFNLCAASGLDIWDVIFSKGNYIFSMGIHDFFSSKPFIKKAKIRLRIQQKLGLLFFLIKQKKETVGGRFPELFRISVGSLILCMGYRISG